MPSESRVKRWRDNKRQQGLKHVSVWLTPEEELRLKDLAIQWHCSPSQVVQRSLAQMGTIHTIEHGSSTDTSLIRELVREELAAMQVVQRQATVGNSGGPTDTQTAGKLSTRPATGQTKLTPLQGAEMREKHTAGTPIKALMQEYGISRATLFRYLAEGKDTSETRVRN